MSTADLIAIGAMLLAGLSALYARQAVNAAKRTNEISIHNERLMIYKDLLNHRAILTQKGPRYPEEALWRFYDAVQLSEFYYGTNEYEKLKKIFDDSSEIKNLSDKWDLVAEKDKKQALIEETQKLHRATREHCTEIIEVLKPKLRIGNLD